MLLNIINFVCRISTPSRSDNIIVRSVPTMPFLDNFHLTRWINDRLIVFWVNNLRRSYHLEIPTVIFYNPRFSCTIGKIGEILICYDIIDNKLEFKAIPKWIGRNHDFLVDSADLIVTSSDSLYNRIYNKRKRKDVYMISNGVEIFHFSKAMHDLEIPNDIKHIKRPILGYSGAVGEWFDLELLEEILAKNPHISVVLIGWAFNKERLRLKRMARSYHNLYFLGRRSYNTLPSYYRVFTICVIPFRVTALTESVNPTKLYEYLAARKPVISTALPEVLKYEGPVCIAKDSNDFQKCIDRILSGKSDNNELMEMPKEIDWVEKSSTFVGLIKSYRLASRGSTCR
jgi:glycosyltransferase involved in cell wall biosynthesis